MDQANKRRKLNNYHNGNTPHSDAIPAEHSEGSSSRSSKQIIHSGKGIQNSNGHIHIGRDYSAQHTYNNFRIHSATLNQASNDPDVSIIKEKHRKVLISSLKFSQIDARRTNIKRAHAKTCQWFLKTQEYIDWLDINRFDDHGGLLWIKGKPGVGKSTLMSSTFSRVRPKLKEKGNIVVSFFFNARGEDLEKTTSGLYRALLVQLFEALPGLPNILDNWSVSEWTVESLEKLFEEAILAVGKATIVCFVDALDECDEKEIRDMLSFLQSTSEQAASNETRMHICFASRHYPHITINWGLSLIIEGQTEHDKDITRYLDAELHIGHGKLAEQVRSDLQKKSSGIFMWVVLVVDILNKAFDCGHSRRLPGILREIPGDLHALFRDILTRGDVNSKGLLLCIQWVLFAVRPLSPEELYFAIMSEIEPNLCHQDQEDAIDPEVIRKYILDNSKGLAESTQSTTPTVQFIHESVRDFFLKEKGLQNTWPSLGRNIDGQSHEQLKICCMKYLRNHVVCDYKLPYPFPKASSPAAASLRQETAKRFEFLEYATHNILYHAEKAERKEISQKEFLSSIPLHNLIKYINLFEIYDARQYTWEASLQYILAENNFSALLRAHPFRRSCFEVERERYGTAIFAACATKSHEAVQALLELEALDEPPESAAHALCEQHAKFKERPSKFGRDFTYSQQKGLLYQLIEQDDELILAFILAQGKYESVDLYRLLYLAVIFKKSPIIIQLLLEQGVDVSGQDPHILTRHLELAITLKNNPLIELLLEGGASIDGNETYNPLYSAVRERIEPWSQDETLIEYLLNKGANVNGAHGYNPLSLAIKKGYLTATELLLANGAIDGNKTENPLSLAAKSGHETIVQLLLEHGANADQYEPMKIAVGEGHTAIVQLLLDHGASAWNFGPNLLQSAVMRGHIAIVQLLLDRGANVDGFPKHSPICSAAEKGYTAIVQLLLDRGANVDGDFQHNPIQLAVKGGQTAVTEVLIRHHAKIEYEGFGGRTRLMDAVLYGHTGIVQLLLTHGANFEARDNNSNTPLSLTSNDPNFIIHQGPRLAPGRQLLDPIETRDNKVHQGPRPALARQLLNHRANIESRDNKGNTTLLLALTSLLDSKISLDFHNLMFTYKEYFELFLERGANIYAENNNGDTPLSVATSNKDNPIARLFLNIVADIGAGAIPEGHHRLESD